MNNKKDAYRHIPIQGYYELRISVSASFFCTIIFPVVVPLRSQLEFFHQHQANP